MAERSTRISLSPLSSKPVSVAIRRRDGHSSPRPHGDTRFRRAACRVSPEPRL
jgi:hypothetical protein